MKLDVKSAAMLSGGSSVSWSVTASASTVIVHAASRGSWLGGIERERGRPAADGDRDGRRRRRSSEKAPSAASTGSLKVTVTFVSRSTSTAPLLGLVDVTRGASSPGGGGSSQSFSGSDGAFSRKSVALLSVSEVFATRS